MISPNIVRGWCQQIVTAMNEIYGENVYTMDMFSYYFRIWHKDSVKVPVVYVRKTYGYVYQPCTRNRIGPNKIGKNAGVLWDLSDENQREQCLLTIQNKGIIFESPGKLSSNTYRFGGELTEDESALLAPT